MPSEAVAEVVWAGYHDEAAKLHWCVPDDLEPFTKNVLRDMEAERSARIRHFLELVGQRSSIT